MNDCNQNELRDWLALNRLHGLTSQDILFLADKIGELYPFFNPEGGKKLIQLEFSQVVKQQIRQLDWAGIEREIQWSEAPNHHVVTLTSVNYPKLLKEITAPPIVLFVHGDISCLNQKQLAIVGSRNPSHLGRETAVHFAQYLAGLGLVITSGLAMGIDTASHEGALMQGETVAVLGSGLSHIYPKQNKKLAENISEKGAVISEFPLSMPPCKENFPRRNRIISGLSIGVLVVEAALHSGSLITAKLAADQGREIFAIPGSIHNPLSRGCHRLIREGAKLVETAQDIVEELSGFLSPKKKLGGLPKKEFKNEQVSQSGRKKITKKLDFLLQDKEYVRLLSCIDLGTTAVDTIMARSGFGVEVVSSMLLLLELEGYIIAAPGGYCRVRK